jgi:hypothetical protein
MKRFKHCLSDLLDAAFRRAVADQAPKSSHSQSDRNPFLREKRTMRKILRGAGAHVLSRLTWYTQGIRRAAQPCCAQEIIRFPRYSKTLRNA